jgi:hypothetical protein
VTNTSTGVWAYQAYPPVLTGSGFQITIPADVAPRKLLLFVGTFAARGRLEASLSDGGPSYTDTSLFNSGNGPGGVYALDFQANSSNQTLTVKWTLSQRAGGSNAITGNVTLQAAALTAPQADNPPLVSLVTPPNQSSFAGPTNLTVQAIAEDFDGTVTNLDLFQDQNLLAACYSPPYEGIWNNANSGRYLLRAWAQDNSGGSRWSPASEVFVFGTGGQLNGSVATPPPGVDLTAEGTADWVHWGLLTNTSINRKSGVVPQIPNFISLGTNPMVRYGDNATAFSWIDGMPTLATTNPTSTGVYVTGIDNGFELRLPADPHLRTARLYTGGYGVRADLEAYLSDFSAPPYIDHTVSNVFDNVGVVYTFSYSAATTGQTLIVRHRIAEPYDFDFGNVTLQAVTLQDPLAAPPLRLGGRVNGDKFEISFNTQANLSYTVQYVEQLGSSWTTLVTLPGTGGVITVPDALVAGGRLYRVHAE